MRMSLRMRLQTVVVFAIGWHLTETRRCHARNSLVDNALHSRRTDINRLPSIETHGQDVASSSCGHDLVRFRVRFFGTETGPTTAEAIFGFNGEKQK